MYYTREEATQDHAEYPEYATYDELEIGMRVMCPTVYCGREDFEGECGTIVHLGEGWDISIDWDNSLHDMHDCGGFAKPRHGYNSDIEDTDLIIIDKLESSSFTQEDVEDILSLI